MNKDSDVWVTEDYIAMQERLAARLVDMVPEDSDRARHEVSLYGALSGLRRQLHERAVCLRQDSNSLAPASTLGGGQANADRPQARHTGERNRPSAQRNQGRGSTGRRNRKKDPLVKVDKDAIRKHAYCVEKLRLIRRAVRTLGERDVHNDGATIGVPSLSNKVNALGAARWCKIPWTRGTTNQLLRQRMGDPLYELCFAHSSVVRTRAQELDYEMALTWGKICILNRLDFALKVLRSHGARSISATSPTIS
jgi:hypothetical protein